MFHVYTSGKSRSRAGLKHLLERSAALSFLLLAAQSQLLQTNAAGLVDDREWQKLTNSGNSAYEAANYGKAERDFVASLREAEKIGESDIRVAQSCTNLGVLYNFRGQGAKAEPLFEKAVAIKLKTLGAYNKDVLDSEQKLFHFYLKSNETAKAESIATQIAAVADKTIKEREQLNVHFEKISAFYQKHPEMEDSEILVRQAQQSTKKASVTQDTDLAVLLDSIGQGLQGRSKLEQAEPFLKKALMLREGALSSNHVGVAASMEALGKLYLAENKCDLAEPLFKKALAISQQTLGPTRAETYSKLDALGQCYVKAGKLSDATSLYRKALADFSAANGNSNPSVMACQVALGNILCKEGRYSEASSMLGQALKAAEKINGPQHASLCPLLDAYADALDRANKRSEASHARSRAIAIRG